MTLTGGGDERKYLSLSKEGEGKLRLNNLASCILYTSTNLYIEYFFRL